MKKFTYDYDGKILFLKNAKHQDQPDPPNIANIDFKHRNSEVKLKEISPEKTKRIDIEPKNKARRYYSQNNYVEFEHG